jgi:MurNAc alpha-1-phosphate uridylyltransferase
LTTPKPLLPVGGKPLIAWHIERLVAVGVREIVINTSWLAAQCPLTLGDGSHFGARLHYSFEGEAPLETGGGIRHALPLLGDAPFIVVSADIVSDYDYARLPIEPDGLAHLVMVPNPDFHPRGDFRLDGSRLGEDGPGERLTFANIGVYRPELVAGEAATRFKLLPMFQRAMREGRLSGERHDGFWRNLGTPAQLAELESAGWPTSERKERNTKNTKGKASRRTSAPGACLPMPNIRREGRSAPQECGFREMPLARVPPSARPRTFDGGTRRCAAASHPTRLRFSPKRKDWNTRRTGREP